MSHRSKVSTQINDLEILKKTIEDLGYSYYEGQDLSGSYTSSWSAEERKVDLVMDISGRKDLGFRKNDKGFYELVGDFYGLAMGQNKFTNSLKNKYAANKIRKEIEGTYSYGITSLTETILPNGDIELEGEIDEQIVNG